MLTSIVKATRAHYAALQHRPGPDRVPLDYSVIQRDRVGSVLELTRGTIRVKVDGPRYMARRRAERTKLQNRLRTMFPEATTIEVSYRE